VTQREQRERYAPCDATGTAALSAGWSHGHRDVSGGWLRPTVFGAVDGLVTNASLISGLSGGGVAEVGRLGVVPSEGRICSNGHTRVCRGTFAARPQSRRAEPVAITASWAQATG
jgi:hypothetical protein